MIDALHISESGLRATQKWIDSISNNVANMQTAGFKKSAVHFSNLVRGGEPTDGAASGNGTVTGAGTRLAEQVTVFSMGSVQATNSPLDVVIQGNGFFEVLRDDGSLAYTRLGRLKVAADGQLTSISGAPLSGDIRIPPDVEAIDIQPDGTIRGRVSGSEEIIELGQLKLARIGNPEAMHAIGDGFYVATSESGDASIQTAGSEGVGSLLQGHLEMSNVDLVEEMTSLVLAQRAYQLNARIVQTADQVMETINNLRR